MTAILALVRKDLLLYLNDRRALMLHLLIPIVVAAFFGTLFGGGDKGQSGKIDVALVQLDRADLYAALFEDLFPRCTNRCVADQARRARMNADDIFLVRPERHDRLDVGAADCLVERGFDFFRGFENLVWLGHDMPAFLSRQNVVVPFVDPCPSRTRQV